MTAFPASEAGGCVRASAARGRRDGLGECALLPVSTKRRS
jgi:hypothetical protein